MVILSVHFNDVIWSMNPTFGQIALIGKSHASSSHGAAAPAGQPILASLVAFLLIQGCDVVV